MVKLRLWPKRSLKSASKQADEDLKKTVIIIFFIMTFPGLIGASEISSETLVFVAAIAAAAWAAIWFWLFWLFFKSTYEKANLALRQSRISLRQTVEQGRERELEYCRWDDERDGTQTEAALKAKFELEPLPEYPAEPVVTAEMVGFSAALGYLLGYGLGCWLKIGILSAAEVFLISPFIMLALAATIRLFFWPFGIAYKKITAILRPQ